MAATMPAPLTKAEAEAILAQQQQARAELERRRIKTSWLSRQLDRLIAENHLAEKVRNALESK